MAAARTGMHASGSASSLTHLADSGCIFCSESAGEKGEELVESGALVKCACKFSAHLSCWHEAMSAEGPKVCPNCEKSLVPPYLVRALSESHAESEAEGSTPKPLGLRWIAMIVFLCLIILGFAIGMGVSGATRTSK